MNPVHQSKSTLSRGYSFALLSALLLSTTAILIRYLTQNSHIDALVLAFWRDVIAAASILLALLIIKPALLHVKRSDLFYLIGYGFILALFNALWTLSVAMNGAAIATVLVYSSAAFTALLGRWLLKETLDWPKVVAVFLTICGCLLVSGLIGAAGVKANSWGIIAGILAGLFYAVYSLMGRFASQRGLNPWTTLPYIFGFASLFLLATNLLAAGQLQGAPATAAAILWKAGSLDAWAILFALAVGPTLLGFATYLISLSILPSSLANLLMTTEPVFTSITAFLLLGERMTLIQIGGSLLILGGVVFIRLMEGRRERLAAAAEKNILPAAD